MGRTLRYAIGSASAGAIVGTIDALLALARPGTESVSEAAITAALALDVSLHAVLGGLPGALLGPLLVDGAQRAWRRSFTTATC